MPDYTQYKGEDFLADESFSNYLLQKQAADIQFWQQWIRDNPQCSAEIRQATRLFFLLKSTGETSGDAGTQVEIDRRYAALQSLLKESNSGAQVETPFPKKENNNAGKSIFRRIPTRAAAVAAIFLVAVSLSVYFIAVNKAPSETVFVLFAKTDSAPKDVTLPDGSRVQLNRYSSVEIAKEYNRKKREVLLAGSAFFNVYKDRSKPFVVLSGSIKSTALGTSFYIYNLHPEAISVSLLEGKLRVEGAENFVELLPGEKAVADSGARIYKDTFNKRQLLNFTCGKIQFEHADLQEIKTVLKEYFNKDVLIKGDAPQVNFTGNFDAKNIETILKALQFTYNIKYKSAGQNITISFN